MFSGIVQGVATVEATREPAGGAGGVRLAITRPSAWAGLEVGLRPGDSVAVSGCCLTLVRVPGDRLEFDVVRETLDRTTLGALRNGARVNVERSLALGDPIGGHIVQGHIDAVAEVLRVSSDTGHRVRFGLARGAMEQVTPKGCIAVDGVSLTVAALNPDHDWFEVALIPATLQETTLGSLQPGTRVNIETDAMVRALVHWHRHYAAPQAVQPARGTGG